MRKSKRKTMTNKTMTTLIALMLISFTNINRSFTQTVNTFVTGSGLNGPDGFTLDSAENLYVANWGGGVGHTVLKITPEGEVSVFAEGFSAPDGLAFDNDGNLFVSNYGSDIINKVEPDGTISEFASGFNNPSDLVFDADGNLYVSNHGNANGTTVSKIEPDGTVSTFASGFNGPIGLVFDNDGNLYVSNYSSGIINKVTPAGDVSEYASIPNSPLSRLQYLIFDTEGNLYVPSYGHHKIYIINPAGEVDVFAGTGIPGNTNGSVDSAQFNGPNSIAITDSGVIYVSEYNANRIRKIVPDTVVGMNEVINTRFKGATLYQNAPNPFLTSTELSYQLQVEGDVILSLCNLSGNKILTINEGLKMPGVYSVNFTSVDYQPGIYFYMLYVNSEFIDTKKMVLLK